MKSKGNPEVVSADPLVSRVVAFCCGYAYSVVLLAAVLAGAALIYVTNNISIDTDSTKLISPDLPWRQRDARFDADFPQSVDQIVVVVDAVTPELAERATAVLADRLALQTELFRTVRRPDGGAFFNRNGLLFLSVKDLSRAMDDLIAAQPLLGSLSHDPSLRGFMSLLSTGLLGVKNGEAKLSDLSKPIAALSRTLEGALDGNTVPLSWRSLVTGRTADARGLRRLIIVQPVLDFSALAPGAAASDAIRAAASNLGFVPMNGVRVRLTGPVPLADEEFSTVTDGAASNAVITVGAVVLLLWLALRSPRIILSILLTVAVGLLCTAAFALAVVGSLNLISVAFAVLFVGLGVDFGIQFGVRYRTERHARGELQGALTATGGGIGRPLALAAASTAAGFYAFLPTDYRGVSELGLIAGTGMFIAFFLSITLLPALIKLVAPRGEIAEIGYRFLAPFDRFVTVRRRTILGISVLMAAGCIILLPGLTFDFNPINLKNPNVESVATLFDLMKDPNTTPNTIDVLAPSLADAEALSARLSALPEVSQTITLQSFVPDQQPQKLELILDAALLLEETFNPTEVKPEPTDAENRQALAATARSLRAAAGAKATPGSEAANHLADLLDRFAIGEKILRDRATEALVPGLKTLLDQIRLSLTAEAVSADTLPTELIGDWIGKDGRARIQVFPKGDANDNAALQQFTRAVLAVAPEATGAPISVQESSRTIVHAFQQAGAWALLSITVLLSLVLRRIRDVLLTLIPLFLAGLLTLGTCVVIGQPINFANIIALPLLFGIGVAFDIYFVMAWRSGARDILQSSLTRAIIFSALTTATAFGSLWLSNHPGTASMGKLLLISLGWTLVATLLFLPAILAQFGTSQASRLSPPIPTGKIG
jgi:hopanoid biosynthesis associated RND transporter like protein HpnN